VGLQVILLGRLRPELGVSGTHEGVAVADLRHPDAVQDAIAKLTGGEGSVLVLCQERDVREVRRHLSLVDVALPRVTTLLEPVAGSPLAVSVCAGVLDDESGDRDPALQLATLDTLRARIWSSVWLPSVHRLDAPQPSLTQHIRSWFGGAGFLVSFTDDAVLACKQTMLPAPERAPRAGILMVADTGSPSWVVSSFQSALEAVDRTDVRSWRDPRDAFGTTSAAELLVVPADLDDPDATAAEATECPGCGNRHGRSVCPYCRMVVPAVDGAEHDLQGADA
jgi:hypothetical protein